jgi:hypothetical protein
VLKVRTLQANKGLKGSERNQEAFVTQGKWENKKKVSIERNKLERKKDFL